MQDTYSRLIEVFKSGLSPARELPEWVAVSKLTRILRKMEVIDDRESIRARCEFIDRVKPMIMAEEIACSLQKAEQQKETSSQTVIKPWTLSDY